MEVLTYPSANGLHDIKATLWKPKGMVRGIVQLVHGMREYRERYANIALYLTDRGYAVCINDHAGHGDSIADIRGYMGPQDGYKHMIQDVRTLFELVKARYPDSPYFMLGHSMGSFIARAYCASYGTELDGAIFSGTGQAPGIADFGILICRMAISLGKRKVPAKLLSRISDISYNKNFRPSKSNADWLSRDTAQVYKFLSHPKSKFTFTYGGYLDLLLLLKSISTKSWLRALPKKLPFYLFAGSDDPVGNYGKDVQWLHEALLATGCHYVTMKIYPGGRHEMINEINKAEVYNDLHQWLEQIRAMRGLFS